MKLLKPDTSFLFGKTRKKYKRWTQEEIDYLLDSHLKRTGTEVCKHLKRSPSAVSTKNKELGIKLLYNNKRSPKDWTEEEIEYLKNCEGKVTKEEVARILNVHVNTVYKQTAKLGISLLNKNNKWTNKEKKILIHYFPFNSSPQLGKLLNKHPSTVRSKCQDLKLSKTKINWEYALNCIKPELLTNKEKTILLNIAEQIKEG